jgi:ABC-type branched-subunit amino acid transport system ATPase component
MAGQAPGRRRERSGPGRRSARRLGGGSGGRRDGGPPSEGAVTLTALLRAQGVAKAFGGVQALVDCTIEVERGSITGLIGPNGSGKTTLFNVITGYERVDSGAVFLDGGNITNVPPQRVFARGIGRTFQLTRIFPRLTVMENMLVAAPRADARRGRFQNPLARSGRPADRDRAMELLAFTGIADHATALAGTLSYGQRKLLELAYVLVADPAVVLLDEPAGGINPSLITNIAGRIRELNGAGTTFLIVEHNMDFVMGLCDEVTVLDYGTVVATGPPELIRKDPRVLDAYLGIEEGDDE